MIGVGVIEYFVVLFCWWFGVVMFLLNMLVCFVVYVIFLLVFRLRYVGFSGVGCGLVVGVYCGCFV